MTPRILRTFLGWDRPALPSAAEILVAHHAATVGIDMRSSLLAVPGGRAGRRLLELLLDEADRIGKPLIPPARIVTMGRLPDLLYSSSQPLAGPAEARRAFARALEEVDPRDLSRVFANRPESATGWLALAEVMETLQRQLGGEGWTFAEVAAAPGTGIPRGDKARWQVLAGIQARYLHLLAHAGRVDRDQARKEALQAGRLQASGEIWLVGVVELPGLVARMLRALPGPVRSLIHAPEEHAARFDDLGCVLAEGWQDVHLPLDDDNIHVAGRPLEQTDTVTDILRGFTARYSAEEIVIGVPDGELIPYLERSLSAVRIPHRRAAGTPMGESGPFLLLKAVADYLDGRHFASLALLLRHPDLQFPDRPPTGRIPAGALELLDRYHADHLPVGMGRGRPVVSRHGEAMQSLLAGLDEFLHLDRLAGEKPVSAWMPCLLDLLVSVYGTEHLHRGHPHGRHILEACAHIKDKAAALSGVPSVLDSAMPAHEAIRHLLAELRQVEIPPDPEQEAVQFLGWLELPLDDAPAVILTGFNEPHIPKVVTADPFLPGALRTFLGLVDDRRRYARDVYLLAALLQSRREVHLIAGRRSAAGDPLRPSRLLFAAGDDVAARRILRHLDRPVGGVVLPGSGSPETGESLFRSPPEEKIKGQRAPESISVTAFKAFLADPYRFALERLLKLERLDDTAREMDALHFGNLAHDVLHRFGQSDVVHDPDVRKLRGALDDLLDTRVRECFGARAAPAVGVQREQLRSRLRAFAAWHAGRLEEGWRVAAVEVSPGEGVPFEVDGTDILLRGRIDRIDHHAASGRWALLDYKTSEKADPPEKMHRRGPRGARTWQDLQLPLYRHLLAGIPGPDGSPLVPAAEQGMVDLGYVLLPRTLADTGASMASWTEEDLDVADETARQVVRLLRKGVFLFDPDAVGRTRFREDPLAALLGHLELPRMDDDENEDAE